MCVFRMELEQNIIRRVKWEGGFEQRTIWVVTEEIPVASAGVSGHSHVH